MKRSPFSAVLALLVVSCGSSFSSSDETPAPPGDPNNPVDPGSTAPPPPPPPVVGAPPVDELTEQFGLFVVEGAKPDGLGTRQDPSGSIANAVNRAKANNRRVYVCAGTYKEAFTIVEGVSVFGGYTCNGGWALGGPRPKLEAPTSPALQARNIKALTRFDGFEVTAPDGNDTERSSIGLIAENADGLSLSNISLTAGKGANGKAGTTPADASFQGNPNGGEQHLEAAVEPTLGTFTYTMVYLPNPFPRGGGAGGSGTCSAGPAPGAGGGGGGGAAYVGANNPALGNFKFWELKAAAGAPGGGTGAPGTDGQDGAVGVASFNAQGYAPGDGTAGLNGGAGAGGAGGAGVSTPSASPAQNQNVHWFATSGGGGGAGGCAGLAGTPGTGGGASVAALVINSPELAFKDATLTARAGGAGGAGSLGSLPTAGGAAGTSAVPATPGGRGGVAGYSGSGAGGPSIALAHVGAAPKTTTVSYAHGLGGSGVPEQTRRVLNAVDQTMPATLDGKGSDVEAL
ncbi:MAG: hypothetical protein R3B36_28300 [Polyangiaceae bacterium]